MAFFSDLGKKVSLTAQEVTRQAKESAGISKQENLIADEKRKINVIYQQIGALYYELHADSCEDSFETLVNQIKDCECRIAQCLEEIDRIKGLKKCPQCGSEITYSAMFCNSCGYRMESDTQQLNTGNTVKCATCGCDTNEGSAFCENCGSPISNVQQAVDISTAEESSNVKCKNCGEDVGTSAFCPNCGTKIE